MAVSPADGLTVSVTMPVKPLRLLAAIGVDCGQRGVDDGPVRLQFTVTGVEGEIAKSLKLNVAEVEWVSVPLLPVIGTVNVPAVVELHVSEPVCGDVPKVTLAVIVHVSPDGTVAASATVPVNPLRPVTVIVEDAVVVPSAGTEAGDVALIVKSTTWNVIMLVVWLRVPSVPVTATV